MAAIDDAISRLAARTLAQYLEDSSYIEIFPPDLNAVATIGSDVSSKALQIAATYALIAASVATAQAIVGLTQKVGSDILSLPRNVELGGAAYLDYEQLQAIFPSTQNAAYQMVVQDWGKLLLTTTGTNTWTLPAAADLPDGWWCQYRNRSGANLTIARSGADTMNAAATSVTVATGAAIGLIVRTSSSTFEVA